MAPLRILDVAGIVSPFWGGLQRVERNLIFANRFTETFPLVETSDVFCESTKLSRRSKMGNAGVIGCWCLRDMAKRLWLPVSNDILRCHFCCGMGPVKCSEEDDATQFLGSRTPLLQQCCSVRYSAPNVWDDFLLKFLGLLLKIPRNFCESFTWAFVASLDFLNPA